MSSGYKEVGRVVEGWLGKGKGMVAVNEAMVLMCDNGTSFRIGVY